MEIYLEPVLPAARLLVFGVSPVARALARLGHAMGFSVEVADPDADAAAFPEAARLWTDLGAMPAGSGAHAFAVVATMGERDEEALAASLRVAPEYVGVVASRRRYAQIREGVATRGVSEGSFAKVKSPAGLDIGARAPEEIALSILAEIVQVRRTTSDAAAAEGPTALLTAAAREEVDPVCGMRVAIAGAKHTASGGGRDWYFCCGGCRERFLAAPERYTSAQAGIAGLGGTS